MIGQKKKSLHCSKDWGGSLSVKGFDTKGLGCLLEIQSAAFFKEWPRCEKAWLEAESGERADFGCLALTQVREPRARKHG